MILDENLFEDCVDKDLVLFEELLFESATSDSSALSVSLASLLRAFKVSLPNCNKFQIHHKDLNHENNGIDNLILLPSYTKDTVNHRKHRYIDPNSRIHGKLLSDISLEELIDLYFKTMKDLHAIDVFVTIENVILNHDHNIVSPSIYFYDPENRARFIKNFKDYINKVKTNKIIDDPEFNDVVAHFDD